MNLTLQKDSQPIIFKKFFVAFSTQKANKQNIRPFWYVHPSGPTSKCQRSNLEKNAKNLTDEGRH